ncbi:MAG: hypothetical protein Kow0065_15640 [Methylomicrobium sp.]
MSEPHWRLFDERSLKMIDFAEAWLVYHCGTGETHCLDDNAKDIFELFWVNRKVYSLQELLTVLKNTGEIDEQTLLSVLEHLRSSHLLKN